MKIPLLFSVFLSAAAFAQDLKPIASPDLKAPLSADWVLRHGTWEIKDGEITAAELPEQKHAAVLWHQVALQTGAVECEFQFSGARGFLLGCDGDKHVGRIVITNKEIRLMDDSTEVKGKTPSTLLASAKLDLKANEWHKLRYEWSGERMAATLDGTSVEATNASLGLKKSRWWFAVSGASMKIREVKVLGVQP